MITTKFAFTATSGQDIDAGTITLSSDANVLEEVVITGTIDLAKDRETPVAVSTITAIDIQKNLGKVDKSGSYYRWNIAYSQNELTSIINQKLDLNAKSINKLVLLKRGFSGRIIKLEID